MLFSNLAHAYVSQFAGMAKSWVQHNSRIVFHLSVIFSTFSLFSHFSSVSLFVCLVTRKFSFYFSFFFWEREINTNSFPIWFIFVHLLDIYSSRVGKQHGALPSVIVIGGGISGIAAARMLQNASLKVFIPSKWYFMSDCVFISFPSDNVFLFYSGNLVGITR